MISLKMHVRYWDQINAWIAFPKCKSSYKCTFSSQSSRFSKYELWKHHSAASFALLFQHRFIQISAGLQSWRQTFRFSEKANINMQAGPIADKKFDKLWLSKSSLVFFFEKAFPSCFTYFSFRFPWYEKHPVEVRMQTCAATMVLHYSFNAFFYFIFWENEKFGVFASEIHFWIVVIKALNPESTQNSLKANKTFCAAEKITKCKVCLSKHTKERELAHSYLEKNNNKKNLICRHSWRSKTRQPSPLSSDGNLESRVRHSTVNNPAVCLGFVPPCKYYRLLASPII